MLTQKGLGSDMNWRNVWIGEWFRRRAQHYFWVPLYFDLHSLPKYLPEEDFLGRALGSLSKKKGSHWAHKLQKIPLSELCTCEPDFGGMYWMGSSITLPAGPGNFVWNTPAKRHATALLEQCLCDKGYYYCGVLYLVHKYLLTAYYVSIVSTWVCQ